MRGISTRQAAKKLGITHAALSRYITAGKVPAPQTVIAGGMTVHLWTEEQIEHVRKLLPKIANGRKTRYQKLREKQGTQPRAAALHKKRKPTKKK
jgi:predicted transcriptional regulator